jgi:hypothetical protein
MCTSITLMVPVIFLLFPIPIPLRGLGTTCFSPYCDKDLAIICLRLAACLTLTLVETGLAANDFKRSRD